MLSAQQVLDAVVTIHREAARARTTANVADAVVRIAGELIGADQGTLGLVRDGEVMTVAALIPPRQPIGSHFPVGFGVAGWVAATGRPAEIQDVRLDKRYVALPYPEVRSFVGVPLQSGADLVGVLSLAAWRPAAFAPQTAEMLAPLAEEAALLLRAAAEDEALRERLARVERAARDGLAETLHELKAPLHTASGFIDLVADELAGPLNDQQRDFLKTAQAECARLKDALASAVEIGAVAAERPLDFEQIEAAEIVSSAVERHQGQALRSNIRLSLSVDEAAGPVQADAAAIQQVLANFLQNALRYAPSDTEIMVSAAPTAGSTVFAIADRGPGLDDADLERIFEPYQQRGERSAGTVGLGLAIARRIVEQHNGRIWAENQPDGGSRFCFSLPSTIRQIGAGRRAA